MKHRKYAAVHGHAQLERQRAGQKGLTFFCCVGQNRPQAATTCSRRVEHENATAHGADHMRPEGFIFTYILMDHVSALTLHPHPPGEKTQFAHSSQQKRLRTLVLKYRVCCKITISPKCEKVSQIRTWPKVFRHDCMESQCGVYVK